MNKVLVFFTVLLLSACNNTQPVFTKLSTNATILAFGDSLTYGTGATKADSYPAILSELSSRQVVNAGIPGEISQDGLARLPGLLDEIQPELLILIHGGNDILRKHPLEKTAENLKQMILAANHRNIRVIMLGVPKPGLFLMSSAEIYQQVADEHQTPIDVETLPNILGSNQLKSDAIHPNRDGYRVMAENIYSLLVNTGAL